MVSGAAQVSDAAEAVALYETTQEICSRLDLDQVLGAIVARARQLLGAEFGYLAVADDDHAVLRMRAVDGIQSEGFRTAVLPYGVGLGGTVAAQRAPISTADYLVDFSMSHSDTIDAVVDEEGMRAGVGVPVEFQGKLLAVLFAGRRTTRGFTPHQVTLLSSLGNSAAIAINNAQTHGRLAQAMSLHTDLVAPALAGAGPRAIAQVLSALSGSRVLCLDWLFDVVAHGDSDNPLDTPSEEDLGQVAAEPGRTHMIVTADGTNCRARAIVLGEEVEGYVVIETQPGWDDLAALACEQAATVFALEFAKLRSADQVESAFHGDLFDELTSGREIDAESVLRRATRLGCDLEQPHLIVVARPLRELSDGRSLSAWKRVTQLATSLTREEFGDSLIASQPQEFWTAVGSEDPDQAVAAFGQLNPLLKRLGLPPVRIGVSRAAVTLDDYALCRSEAELASEYAVSWRVDGEPVRFTDLGFHLLALGAQPRGAIVAMAGRTLAPLTEYDSRSRGGLRETLEIYLEMSCNAEATARHLGVHANTLRARLEKIERLLDCDLGRAVTRLDLHLAVTAVRLASHS